MVCKMRYNNGVSFYISLNVGRSYENMSRYGFVIVFILASYIPVQAGPWDIISQWYTTAYKKIMAYRLGPDVVDKVTTCSSSAKDCYAQIIDESYKPSKFVWLWSKIPFTQESNESYLNATYASLTMYIQNSFYINNNQFVYKFIKEQFVNEATQGQSFQTESLRKVINQALEKTLDVQFKQIGQDVEAVTANIKGSEMALNIAMQPNKKSNAKPSKLDVEEGIDMSSYMLVLKKDREKSITLLQKSQALLNAFIISKDNTPALYETLFPDLNKKWKEVIKPYVQKMSVSQTMITKLPETPISSWERQDRITKLNMLKGMVNQK